MMLNPRQHFIVLRATAIAAIPLCVWLIYSIVDLVGADYATFHAWLAQPVNAVLMILFIIVTFYHAVLGIHEIMEDYIHDKALLTLSLNAKVVVFIILGAICVYAVVKVAFLQ